VETGDLMYGLNGRVGLVTGAGVGIGREIARRLTREGMTIAALDRDAATAESAAAEIGGVALGADVTSPEEVGRAVQAVLSQFEKIDLLVNMPGSHGWDRRSICRSRRCRRCCGSMSRACSS
jgi:NAD(P)-dependent dehydrogenase (short-subunit alcohol dehydrogenase family)